MLFQGYFPFLQYFSFLFMCTQGCKLGSTSPREKRSEKWIHKKHISSQSHAVLLLPYGPALTSWRLERQCALPSDLSHGEAVHEVRSAIKSLHLPHCHQTPLGWQEDWGCWSEPLLLIRPVACIVIIKHNPPVKQGAPLSSTLHTWVFYLFFMERFTRANEV